MKQIVTVLVALVVAAFANVKDVKLDKEEINEILDLVKSTNVGKMLPVSKVEEMDSCSICQTLVNETDKLIHNVNLDTYIQNALDSLCNSITDPDKQAKCQNLISRLLPAVLSLMTSVFSSTMICGRWANVCPDTFPTAPPLGPNPYAQNITNDLICATCWAGFGFLNSGFNNQDFSNYLIGEIQPLCNSIQDPEKLQKCLDTVKKFVGIVFNALNTYLQPSYICEKIAGQYCPAIQQQSQFKR